MARNTWNTKAAVAHVRPKAQRAVNRALLVGVGVAQPKTPVLSGTARRSIHIEEGPNHPTRVSAQLGSDVDYFKWIEIGSNGRPGKYPLTQGLQAAAAALPQEMQTID